MAHPESFGECPVMIMAFGVGLIAPDQPTGLLFARAFGLDGARAAPVATYVVGEFVIHCWSPVSSRGIRIGGR